MKIQHLLFVISFIFLIPSSVNGQLNGWSDWREVSNCYFKLLYRIQREEDLNNDGKYRWNIEFKNHYQKSIHFNFRQFKNRVEANSGRTSGRLSIQPGGSKKSYNFVANSQNIVLKTERFRFGDDSGEYDNCESGGAVKAGFNSKSTSNNDYSAQIKSQWDQYNNDLKYAKRIDMEVRQRIKEQQQKDISLMIHDPYGYARSKNASPSETAMIVSLSNRYRTLQAKAKREKELQEAIKYLPDKIDNWNNFESTNDKLRVLDDLKKFKSDLPFYTKKIHLLLLLDFFVGNNSKKKISFIEVEHAEQLIEFLQYDFSLMVTDNSEKIILELRRNLYSYFYCQSKGGGSGAYKRSQKRKAKDYENLVGKRFIKSVKNNNCKV